VETVLAGPVALAAAVLADPVALALAAAVPAQAASAAVDGEGGAVGAGAARYSR